MDFFSSEDEERRVGCVDQGGPAWPDPSATGEYASNNVSARESEHFERKPD